MKITMSGAEFNRIMRVCAPCVSSDELRQALRYIIIESDGEGNGCATALDGFKMTQTRFLCEGDRCKLLVWPFKKVNKDKDITISLENDWTSVSDGDETISRKTPPAGCYVNHTEIFKKGMEKAKNVRVALNVHHLSQILKAMKESWDNYVVLEIGGDVDQVIVSTKYTAGLLCPVRLFDEYHTPEPWEMIQDG